MTNEELLSVAEIVEKLTDRFNAQAAVCRERCSEYDKLIASMKADHEAKMVEHRAAFGARTEADAKIIAGLRADLEGVRNSLGIQAAKEANKVLGMIEGEGLRGAAERVVQERDGLLTQVQDMRVEIERLRIEAAKCKAERDDLYQREGIGQKRRMDVEDERDALRAEVAALQERLRASIARGYFAQMEVAALKSQNPKHPVKVGEWVRRTKLPGDQSPVGIVKQVTSIRCDGDRYGFADGDFWSVDNCEPCSRQHPAQDGQWVRRTVASGTEPVGTMIQVQRSRTLHSEYVTRGGRVVPWAHCEPCDPPATHDTVQGKAAAEAALKTEPVAEEIKVGDLVEVVSNTGRNTWLADVGSVGTVVTVEEINDSISVCLDDVPGKKNALAGYVSFCDVRKVTT